MHMTIQDFHARFPGRTLIPAEYAGQWIAWNEQRTQIVAYGSDYAEVYDQAVSRGCARPVLHKVARAPLPAQRKENLSYSATKDFWNSLPPPSSATSAR